jgi:glutamate carboxypeptidase
VSAPIAKSLLSYLQQRQDDMVALLREVALLESPSLLPETQGPVLDRLGAELALAGMEVRRLRGRTSGGQLLARPPRAARRGKPAQLLLGHSDTVWPLGTLERMPVEVRDGKLTGPGVYDMKGGLVQGIFALRALRELGLEPPLAPVFLINSDEEIGSGDSMRRILQVARRVSRVFVLEPSLGPAGRLKTRRKGALRFVVRVFGRAAHSGLEPEKGASAIHEMAHVILRLCALADAERGVSVNVGVVSGGQRRNVVAPEARAEVDFRVLRMEDARAIENAVRGLESAAPVIPGTRIEVEGEMDRPPLEPTPGNQALWEAAVRCARDLGLELGEGTAGGASDGSFTSQIVPTLDGLGVVGDGAHALHEHVEIARMPERAALLALLLLEPPASVG